jgi:DNA polymerase elongation subunit (family B)
MVICDIETHAIPDAEQYLTEPVSAPANYKDEAKIAAYIAEKRAEQLSRCALDPDLARVVAIGYAYHDTDRVEVLTARDTQDERLMLEAFWRSAHGHRFVTFNGHKFDLPVLMRRSLYLNVPYPRVNIDRYRSDNLDLFNVLTWNGTINGHSLRFYCARFGITIDDLTTGKDIAAMVAAGDWHGVALHCEADVKATKALAARLGVLPTTKTAEVAEGAF